MRVAGVIFNGGKASRLGGIDKGAIDIVGMSAFDSVKCAMGAADQIFVSVASDYSERSYCGADIIPDVPDFLPAQDRAPGVVLSVLTALDFIAGQGFDIMIMAPVDTPFLPADYSDRMLSAAKSGPVVAISGGAIHGLHAGLPTRNLHVLKRAIVENGLRRISALHAVLASNSVMFSEAEMRNLNRPEDLKSLS